jgi:hypothetical protein
MVRPRIASYREAESDFEHLVTAWERRNAR